MSTTKIPKNDEEKLQELLNEIEAEVRERYWNGKWKSSGASITWHSSVHRGVGDE